MPGFGGLRVVAFESRRAEETAELIRRHGGEPVTAPSMREVPDEAGPGAIELVRRLRDGTLGALVLLTGVGTRALVRAVAGEIAAGELAERLAGIPLVARGPKPVAALRELGLRPAVRAPEPNTWREVLAAIDAAGLDLQGRVVAVQEYGAETPGLLSGLGERGATVLRVPVYRWALPEDLGPLREAVRGLADRAIDVALFTSATQVTHLLEVAGDRAGEVRAALRERVVVGSVGPVCSEALRERGIGVDVEASPPKLGPLVRETARAAPRLLRAKHRD